MADAPTLKSGTTVQTTHSAILLDELRESLENEISQIAMRDWEGEIKQKGDTVRIFTFPSPAASDVVGTTAVDAVSFDKTSRDLVINQHKAVDALLERVLIGQSSVAEEAEVRKAQAHSLAASMSEELYQDLAASGATTTKYLDTVTNVMAKLDMIGALERLMDDKVPNDGQLHAFLSPNNFTDLLKDSGIVSNDFIDTDATARGTFNHPIVGFNVQMSNIAGTASGLGGSGRSVLLHKTAVALAIQREVNTNDADLEPITGQRARRLSADILFGVKTLDALRAEILENT